MADPNPFTDQVDSLDPFRSPTLQESSGEGMYVEQTVRESGLLTAVTVVNYVYGGINILLGGLMLAGGIWLATADFIWSDVDADRFEAVFVQIMLGVILATGGGTLLLGLVALVAGVGVQKRRTWGRTLTLVLGVLSTISSVLAVLIFILLTPLYLAYAIFVLVVLLNSEHARHFR